MRFSRWNSEHASTANLQRSVGVWPRRSLPPAAGESGHRSGPTSAKRRFIACSGMGVNRRIGRVALDRHEIPCRNRPFSRIYKHPGQNIALMFRPEHSYLYVRTIVYVIIGICNKVKGLWGGPGTQRVPKLLVKGRQEAAHRIARVQRSPASKGKREYS